MSSRQPSTYKSLFLLLAFGLLVIGCVTPPPTPAGGKELESNGVTETVTPVLPTRTPGPTRMPRPSSTTVTNVPIDIISSKTRLTIKPRQVATVSLADSPVKVLVHYPGSLNGVQVDAHVIQPASVRWKIDFETPPDDNTVAFTLTGEEPGFFNIEVLAEGYAPARFGVRATASGTALPPGTPTLTGQPTLAAPTARAEAAAVSTHVIVTTVPQMSGPIISTAVTAGESATTSVASAPPQLPAGGQLVVSLNDNGHTIVMHPGERFLLSLGEDYDWTVTSSDSAVVSRVVNILPVKGSQGVYEAHRTGQNILMASGDPICSQAQPPCMLASRLFRVQINVQ